MLQTPNMANIIRGLKLPKPRIELELGAHEFEHYHPIETPSFPCLSKFQIFTIGLSCNGIAPPGDFPSSCIVLEAINMANRIRGTKTYNTKGELELGAYEFEHS